MWQCPGVSKSTPARRALPTAPPSNIAKEETGGRKEAREQQWLCRLRNLRGGTRRYREHFTLWNLSRKWCAPMLHQQISAPGGFQFTLNVGTWSPNISLIFILSAPSEPDPTSTHQETTKQPGCFATPAPKPKTQLKELKSQAIH